MLILFILRWVFSKQQSRWLVVGGRSKLVYHCQVRSSYWSALFLCPA